MFKRHPYLIVSLMCLISFTGCAPQTVPLSTIPARKTETQKLAVGGAQMIKPGMSGADVLNVLGTPNVLTNDKDGLEIWVYDKASNDFEFVVAQDGGWLFSPNNQQSGVISRSNRTLIVAINFDKDKKVKSVQFRQTSY